MGEVRGQRSPSQVGLVEDLDTVIKSGDHKSILKRLQSMQLGKAEVVKAEKTPLQATMFFRLKARLSRRAKAVAQSFIRCCKQQSTATSYW